ncbi:hypothethical protein (plasmid) [Ralstonia solanacearum CMR15]|nr:hypothethical protein [Ralstonia solanacearum CMR15]
MDFPPSTARKGFDAAAYRSAFDPIIASCLLVFPPESIRGKPATDAQ